MYKKFKNLKELKFLGNVRTCKRNMEPGLYLGYHIGLGFRDAQSNREKREIRAAVGVRLERYLGFGR